MVGRVRGRDHKLCCDLELLGQKWVLHLSTDHTRPAKGTLCPSPLPTSSLLLISKQLQHTFPLPWQQWQPGLTHSPLSNPRTESAQGQGDAHFSPVPAACRRTALKHGTAGLWEVGRSQNTARTSNSRQISVAPKKPGSVQPQHVSACTLRTLGSARKFKGASPPETELKLCH